MKKIIFLFFITAIISGCSQNEHADNDSSTIVNNNQKVICSIYGDSVVQVEFQKNNNDTTVFLQKKNVFLIGRYVNNKPRGKFVELDSNLRMKAIKWYNNNSEIFYENQLDGNHERYDFSKIDTNMITRPTIRYYRLDGKIFVRVYSESFPVSFITITATKEFHVIDFGIDPALNTFHVSFDGGKSPVLFKVNFNDTSRHSLKSFNYALN